MAEVSEPMMISDGSGMKQKASVDDLIKIVEDLTRIHWNELRQKQVKCFKLIRTWTNSIKVKLSGSVHEKVI